MARVLAGGSVGTGGWLGAELCATGQQGRERLWGALGAHRWLQGLVAPRAGPQRGERLLPPAALLAPRCPQNPAVGRRVGGVGMLRTTHLGSPVGGRWGGARVQPAELCPHWHMLIACNGENVIS